MIMQTSQPLLANGSHNLQSSAQLVRRGQTSDTVTYMIRAYNLSQPYILSILKTQSQMKTAAAMSALHQTLLHMPTAVTVC